MRVAKAEYMENVEVEVLDRIKSLLVLNREVSVAWLLMPFVLVQKSQLTQ